MSLTEARARLSAPLDERWQPLLDGRAKTRGGPTSTEVRRAGELVARLSAAYNAKGKLDADARALLPARLLFSFPRDVPKGGAAVAELVLAGLLALDPIRPLDVLDLGAGLGATTWGLVRALAFAGQKGTVRATLVDPDEDALQAAKAIAHAAGPEGEVTLEAQTAKGDLDRVPLARDRRFDVVLLGQVLSEADRELEGEARVARQAERLASLLRERVRENGSLVVVEPALRDRTRHLHRVRDALLGRATVFAPCLHQDRCPMLATEIDWCHEDLPIDLPDWLVPIARAAGLRFEGLTTSYLVLRRDGENLGGSLGRRGLRIVAQPKITKGKRELALCGVAQGGAGLVLATRLDRDETEANEALDEALRGDVLAIDPEPALGNARLARDTRVTSLAAEEISR